MHINPKTFSLKLIFFCALALGTPLINIVMFTQGPFWFLYSGFIIFAFWIAIILLAFISSRQKWGKPNDAPNPNQIDGQ